MQSPAESTDVDDTEQKVSKKKERSRKGAPKRFVQNAFTAEEYSESSQAEVVNNSKEGGENEITEDGPVRSKRKRHEKIPLSDELLQGSDIDDGSDTEFKPTGILRTFSSIYLLSS